MTLPASGSISTQQIADELGVVGNVVIPTDVRDLTGVASGSVVLPNDFWGKSNVSFTYHENRANTSGSFTNIDFGAAAADRRVFIAVHWTGSAVSEHQITGGVIGGVAATTHAQNSNRHSGTNETVGAAIMSAIVPTGTEGNVSFSLNTGSFTNVIISSFRGVNLAGASPTSTAIDQANQATKPATGSLNVPADGLTLLAVSLSDLQTISAAGPSTLAYERSDVTLQAEARYQTFMAADASFGVSGTWTSGDHGMAMAALSWDMV